MSAWGIENFENDVALDFVEELTTHKKQLSIAAYLDSFSSKFSPDETSLDECLEFLTVAEILAGIIGAPAEEIPLNLRDWLTMCYIQVDAALAKKAAKTVTSLMKDSEAKEMYKDTPYYKSWQKSQKDLIKRLNS